MQPVVPRGGLLLRLPTLRRLVLRTLSQSWSTTEICSGWLSVVVGAGDSTVNRAALAEDLERARGELHRLLADADRKDAWTKPTRGTRWTNEQLLFHMVFGYMVVQRLLLLVRVLGRFPDGVSRTYARLLDGATRPFDLINFYGSRAAALVYNRHRMGTKMNRVIASLQRSLARSTDGPYTGACISRHGGTRSSTTT